MKYIALLAGLLLTALLATCGEREDASEEYGDLTETPQGLQLTIEEHTRGWGHAECLMCHSLENIHITDRIGDGFYNLEELRDYIEEELLDGEGTGVCMECHGDNGTGLSYGEDEGDEHEHEGNDDDEDEEEDDD